MTQSLDKVAAFDHELQNPQLKITALFQFAKANTRPREPKRLALASASAGGGAGTSAGAATLAVAATPAPASTSAYAPHAAPAAPAASDDVGRAVYCRLCAFYLGELSLKKKLHQQDQGGPAICCQAYKAGYSVVQLNVDAFQVLQDVHTKLGAAHSDFLGKGKHIKPRKL